MPAITNLASNAPTSATPQATRTHGLLDVDPDLGRALAPELRTRAHMDLRVRVHERTRGMWPMNAASPAATTPHLGVLILDGVIASDILLQDVVSTELLGPGDILRPWPLDGSERLLSDQARWMVLADCRVAVLDQRLAVTLARYPEIYAALLERMDTRARRFATTQAIAQLNGVDRRLLAILWHIAERWGRVTPDGVVIALDISHRLLSQLVGARRPTVSTALGELARDGAVQRRADGAWLLHGEPPGKPESGGDTVLWRRRIERPRAADIELRLRRLRREADALQAELAQQCDAVAGSRT